MYNISYITYTKAETLMYYLWSCSSHLCQWWNSYWCQWCRFGCWFCSELHARGSLHRAPLKDLPMGTGTAYAEIRALGWQLLGTQDVSNFVCLMLSGHTQDMYKIKPFVCNASGELMALGKGLINNRKVYTCTWQPRYNSCGLHKLEMCVRMRSQLCACITVALCFCVNSVF